MNDDTTIPTTATENADMAEAVNAGLLDDRYGIYLEFTDDAHPKSYDEWLNA